MNLWKERKEGNGNSKSSQNLRISWFPQAFIEIVFGLSLFFFLFPSPNMQKNEINSKNSLRSLHEVFTKSSRNLHELFDNPHSLGSSLWRNSMSRSATSESNHSSTQWSTSVFSEENTLSPSPDDETQFDPLSTYVSNDIICYENCFSISKLKRTFLACTDADLRDIKDALQNHRDLQYWNTFLDPSTTFASRKGLKWNPKKTKKERARE